jgi:hypothetical protein
MLPVAALVAWTFAVLLLIPFERVRAVMRKQVLADDFKFGESSKVPPRVGLPNRNYMNLLEIPVLFYVACIVLYVVQAVEPTALALAWIYVGLRIAHSMVHLSYNNVVHRLSLFAASNLVLMVIWAHIVLAALDAGA